MHGFNIHTQRENNSGSSKREPENETIVLENVTIKVRLEEAKTSLTFFLSLL